MQQRRVPFITFCILPTKKAWINLANCNFNCKGCFAIAKEDVGRSFSVGELINFFIKSCRQIYHDVIDDVVITGGEPTLNPTYLINLIKGLQEISVTKIALSTNGYFLDENLVKQLKILKINLVKIDVKAFDENLHYWYTGKSNKSVLRAVKLLRDYDLNFYVRTILMPNFVDFGEVEKIAQFLSSINRKITYRIYEFDPKHARYPITRKPTLKEMSEAFKAAKKYLDHVESIPASEAYDSSYKYIEVRDDALLDRFKRIDEISISSIKNWNMKNIPFSKIL
jgi:pyruvate formate lyase activating enzyme